MTSENEKEKLPLVDLGSKIPDCVVGMTKLDKSLFNTSVLVPAIKCLPKLCGLVQREFKNLLFNKPHFRKILPVSGSDKKERLILLHTNVKSEEVFSEKQKKFISENDCSFLVHNLKIDYNDFTFDEILKKVFPEDTKDIVTSFETVGHIAHVNLKPSMLDNKNLIGEYTRIVSVVYIKVFYQS